LQKVLNLKKGINLEDSSVPSSQTINPTSSDFLSKIEAKPPKQDVQMLSAFAFKLNNTLKAHSN
jgi:hypothetical protein